MLGCFSTIEGTTKLTNTLSVSAYVSFTDTVDWRKKPEHFFNDLRTLKDAEIQELMNSDSEDLDVDYEVSDVDYEVTAMRRGHVA